MSPFYHITSAKGSQLAVFDLKNVKSIDIGTEASGVHTPLGEASNLHNAYQRQIAQGDSAGSDGSASAVPQTYAPKPGARTITLYHLSTTLDGPSEVIDPQFMGTGLHLVFRVRRDQPEG